MKSHIRKNRIWLFLYEFVSIKFCGLEMKMLLGLFNNVIVIIKD